MKNQLKVRSVGEGFILYDGMRSMFVSLPFVKENMPGKIVVRERYYKKGDDINLIVKIRIKVGWMNHFYFDAPRQPVLLNGRPIIRELMYDPTGKVRDYRINPNRLTGPDGLTSLKLNLNKQ